MAEDAWRDAFVLEQARPDIVRLVENFEALCRQTNWQKLDESSRPKAIQATLVREIERIVERVRSEDNRAIDEAIRAIANEGEESSRRRWSEHCLQVVVADAVALVRELLRDDNLHRARLSSRKSSLWSSIQQAVRE